MFNRAVEITAQSEEVEALLRIEAAEEDDVVERALSAACQRLHMDAAYVTTMDSRQQTIEAVVGRDEFAVLSGVTVPLEQTFCARMLNGEIPSVVPDTGANSLLHDLRATRLIGAYVGVPVRLSDGRLHGTLCCVSSKACNGLGEDELRFMQVLAGIIAARIERAQGNLARLTERLKSRRSAG
jgi:GAF domain-containing protein